MWKFKAREPGAPWSTGKQLWQFLQGCPHTCHQRPPTNFTSRLPQRRRIHHHPSLSRDSPGSQASEASLCCVHQRSLQVQGQLASATAVSGRVPALTLQISDSQLSSPLSVNPWTTKWVFLFVLKLELLIFDASAVITCLPKYFRSSSSSRWW